MFDLCAVEVQLGLQRILASFPSATGRGCVSPEYRSHLGLTFIAMFTELCTLWWLRYSLVGGFIFSYLLVCFTINREGTINYREGQ